MLFELKINNHSIGNNTFCYYFVGSKSLYVTWALRPIKKLGPHIALYALFILCALKFLSD